jgi:hypothetical protein
LKIKTEPVEEPSAESDNTTSSDAENCLSEKTVRKAKRKIAHKTQMNGSDENFLIRIKNEPQNMDEDLNHNESKEKENSEHGALDSASEPSEGSSERLSTSIDFSDVPLGSTQDDDTMSLFAFDDTFEEEIESEQPRKHIRYEKMSFS